MVNGDPGKSWEVKNNPNFFLGFFPITADIVDSS